MGSRSRNTKVNENAAWCSRRAKNLRGFFLCIETAIEKQRGTILKIMGNWDDAEAAFQMNVQRSKEIGDGEVLAESSIDLAALLIRKGHHKKAYGLLRTAYEQFLHTKNSKGLNLALLNLGIIHELKGEYAQAMECYDQQLAIAQKIKFKHDIAIATGNKGIIYFHMGEYRKSISCYEQQLALSKEMNDEFNMLIVHGNLGVVYQNMGDHKRAITHYEKSLNLSEKLGYKRGISIALGNLGTSYARLGDYEAAIRTQQRNLSITRNLGDRHGESYALGNIGILLMNEGKYDQAAIYFKETLALSESLADKKSIGLALGNLGKLHFAQKRYRKAKTYLTRSTDLLQETGIKYHLCHFLSKLAEAHYALKEYKHALKENARAFDIALGIDRSDVMLSCKTLDARLQAFDDREKALMILRALLSQAQSEEQRANIYYELFRLSGRRTYRAHARDIYRKLGGHTPNVLYKERLKELS